MSNPTLSRITPNEILTLRPNEVFVFGSNLSGIHEGGAARVALKWGAVLGQHYGLHGQTFAIPTVAAQMAGPLPTSVIKTYTDRYIDFVKSHLQQIFLLTPIGCGIAGHKPEDIAPLFIQGLPLSNLHLPQSFWNVLTAVPQGTT